MVFLSKYILSECESTLVATTYTVILRIPYYSCCGELATPLVDGQTSWVYCITLVQSLYISCYVSSNKLVLSYLSLCLLPKWWPRSGCTLCTVPPSTLSWFCHSIQFFCNHDHGQGDYNTSPLSATWGRKTWQILLVIVYISISIH